MANLAGANYTMEQGSTGYGPMRRASVTGTPDRTQAPWSSPAPAQWPNLSGAYQQPPQLTLATDPTYLSYLRTTGLSEAQARANAQRNVDAVNRQLQLAVPGYEQAGEEQLRNIDNTFLAHGTWRGGERLRQQALSQAATQRQIAGAQEGAAQKISDIYNARDQALAQYAMQRQNAAAQAGASIAQQNAFNNALAQAGIPQWVGSLGGSALSYLGGSGMLGSSIGG